MKPLEPSKLRNYLPGQDLLFLGTTPVCYHCHHFNLFLDQTIDDSFEADDSYRLRFAAARDSFKQLLIEAIAHTGATTAVEKLELAGQLVAAMGHGKLQISGDANGGQAVGRYLHYGFSWAEKYGQLVNRRHGADAVAGGFGAAALECAFDVPDMRVMGRETECVAMRAAECKFNYEREPKLPLHKRERVDRDACAATTKTATTGLNEDNIEVMSNGLKDFTAGVGGDERGLVQAFGVFVAMHLTNYYNLITYDAISLMQGESPEVVEPLEDLFRESAHVCAFNTFGGILLSPEWEGMVGAPRNDPGEIVSGCLAIARALGFGHWTMAEFSAGKRLVLETSSSYEASYYATRYGVSDRPKEYFLQGAALAISQLAHRVDWESNPALTQPFYDSLFRGGVPCHVEQTQSLQCGAELSRVVVSHTG